MIGRNHIEQILKLNGLNETAPDEEIRSVLISARWHEDDVKTAIMVLRENKQTHESHIDRMNNVFLSDRTLSPEAIHSLLGIDVEVNSSELDTLRARRHNSFRWQLFSIFICSILLAFASVMAMMYWQNAGPFHPGI